MEEKRADAELVALARSGDKDAFGLLIQRYQYIARYLAIRIVSNEDIALELVQEAMLQAYLSLDHLRDDGRFRSWLYGIVLNVCKSYIRDQKINAFSLEALMGGLRSDTVGFWEAARDPQEIAEERELHRKVLEAMQLLSPQNRAATLLFYYEQLSLQEIAAILGVSVVAVKGRLHKARKQLRERLLPMYAERASRERRRKIMVKATIADVVQQEERWVVVLQDEVGHRALPIWVGQWEARAIAIGLRGLPVPRPMTFSFISSLLEAVDARVEEVRIETLKEDVFYAVVKLHSSERVQEIDARPSDAMALAVRTGSPIYVGEEILEKCGVPIPQEAGKTPRLGKGLDSIARELAQSYPPTVEEREKASQELMAFVFGGEG